ncbi:unnamed protein product [Spodoptera littoralis]|uniref:Uncharacterized protein n=1 Tax=Spodoptera littoralis TaxID=7109 RepID=A0A9P0N022_SPOLI|nr:unnamed protein product [Spodoptera littoralis]CAH1636623.1 unnamed protein product [Spodoptera littoralis]
MYSGISTSYVPLFSHTWTWTYSYTNSCAAPPYSCKQSFDVPVPLACVQKLTRLVTSPLLLCSAYKTIKLLVFRVQLVYCMGHGSTCDEKQNIPSRGLFTCYRFALQLIFSLKHL